MRFYPLAGGDVPGTELKEEYEDARDIGGIRFGTERLYIRQGLRIGHILYADIHRCYRRVMVVPMRMCCGKGNMDVEKLVVEGAGGELAEAPLPDSRAARAVMQELGKKLPGELLTCPPKAVAAEA